MTRRAVLTAACLLVSALCASAEPKHVYLTYSGAPETSIDVNVILTVQKLDQKIEANVHLSGKDIHVECHDADMYAAIDGLVDKLDRQIIKHKEKHQESRSGPSAKRLAD